MHTDNKSKTLALILTVIVALSCLTLLTAKPAIAQNNTNPSVSILYPKNNTLFNVSIGGVFFQLLYQTNDSLSWVGYSINGGGNVTCTGNTTESNAYYKDEYQFQKSGSNTLTLYANDTVGNWATPQTVTYLVNYYADTAPISTSTPTVPEVPAIEAVLTVMFAVTAMMVVLATIRKQKVT